MERESKEEELLLSKKPWATMMLEDTLLLRFSGLGDFSRISKRRFLCAGPAGEVLDFFFFFLGSGTNTPGAKSESESTSVVYVGAN